MERSVLYSRVSTLDKGQDPERQAREMREFATGRRWTFLELVDRLSASKDRPALNELWRLCRQRKVDVVVVHEFSRFARSTVELLRSLEEFNALGVQFVSLREQIDTTTPAGKLVFTVIAALAEFEREMIRMRVRSGMANARAKGVALGRRRKVLDVAYISRRREQGATWAVIAGELRVSPDTCQRAALRAAKCPSQVLM
ncbi:MAG TPA: recombinase family protein [Candidatus Binataceae bacterium]|nr:recombinase family protein [Candidatus Binataceae bacterium]